MTEIVLTADEAAALREVLAGLSVIAERGHRNEMHRLEISAEVWNDLLVRPAQRLRRVGVAALATSRRLR